MHAAIWSKRHSSACSAQLPLAIHVSAYSKAGVMTSLYQPRKKASSVSSRDCGAPVRPRPC